MPNTEIQAAVAAYLAKGKTITQISAGNAALNALAATYNPRFDDDRSRVTSSMARQHSHGDRYEGYYAA